MKPTKIMKHEEARCYIRVNDKFKIDKTNKLLILLSQEVAFQYRTLGRNYIIIDIENKELEIFYTDNLVTKINYC